MSARKEKRGKYETKERGKSFRKKEENKSNSFNFYLHDLALVIPKMQIFNNYFCFKFSLF